MHEYAASYSNQQKGRFPGEPGAGDDADQRVRQGCTADAGESERNTYNPRQFRLAPDLEICAFPQEGLLNNPDTDALMVEASKRGARVVGAAPYMDTNPHGQIDRIFEMAREFDADIDMHLDFFSTAERMDVDYVCEVTTSARGTTACANWRYDDARVLSPGIVFLSVSLGRRFVQIGRRSRCLPDVDFGRPIVSINAGLDNAILHACARARIVDRRPLPIGACAAGIDYTCELIASAQTAYAPTSARKGSAP